MLEGWKQKRAERAKERSRRAAQKQRRAHEAAEYEQRWQETLARQRQAQEARDAEQAKATAAKEARRDALRTPKARLKRTAPPGAPVEVAVEAHLPIDLGKSADMWREDLVKITRKHIRPGEQVLGVFVDWNERRTAYVALTDGFAVRMGGLTFRSNARIKKDGYGGWLLRLTDEMGGPVLVDSWLGQIDHVRKALADVAAKHADATRRRGQAATPAPRLIRSARDAELVAAEWMQVMGFPDARATGEGADGGIDVMSDAAIAQVKAEARPVGRPILQQLVGAAGSMRRLAICFALAGYTPQAVGWADGQDLALFTFDLQGTPSPVNDGATMLMDAALKGSPRVVAQTAGGEMRSVRREGSVFWHGSCPVRHRTADAALRCRNT